MDALQVLFLGKKKAGVSSLVGNIRGRNFCDAYFPTVAPHSHYTSLQFEPDSISHDFEIWDTPTWSLCVNPTQFKGKQCVVFVVDGTDTDSIREILMHWMPKARSYIDKDAALVICVTKNDLECEASLVQIQSTITDIQIPYVVGSSKSTNFGIQVMKLVHQTYQNHAQLRKSLRVPILEPERVIPKGAHIGTRSCQDLQRSASPDLQRCASPEMADLVSSPETPIYGLRKAICLPRDNAFRLFCYRLSVKPIFDSAILVLIFLNSVSLLIEDPLVLEMFPGIQPHFYTAEVIFVAFFNMEALIRICALGVFARGGNGYLNDHWNKLDFLCVVTGNASLIMSSDSNIGFIRALRVLRPLRTINRFPALRAVVSGLLSAVPLLLSVLVLCSFFFLISGVIGLYLFGGTLRRRCVLPDGTPTDLPCNPSATACPVADSQCLPVGSNPNFGYTHFDDIVSASLSIFVLITLEGWGDTTFLVTTVTSQWSFLYFTTVIFIGGLLLMNMIVVVVYVVFSENKVTQSTAYIRTRSNKSFAMMTSFEKLRYALSHVIKREKQPSEKISPFAGEERKLRLDLGAKFQSTLYLAQRIVQPSTDGQEGPLENALMSVEKQLNQLTR